MRPERFADLMEKVGFRKNDPIYAFFTLSEDDLKNPVFENKYTKKCGRYMIVSIWFQEGEVAFWAQRNGDARTMYPFFKEEVDFLAEKEKFQKS